MIRKLVFILVVVYLVVAGTALACGTSRRSRPAETGPAGDSNAILLNYENVRLALLDGSLADVRVAARGVASAARQERVASIADRSIDLQDVPDLAAAQQAFAALSDEVIQYNATTGGATDVVVAYCPMEKKYWLQPKGRISNPYGGEDMRRCGEFVEGGRASAEAPVAHHH